MNKTSTFIVHESTLARCAAVKAARDALAQAAAGLGVRVDRWHHVKIAGPLGATVMILADDPGSFRVRILAHVGNHFALDFPAMTLTAATDLARDLIVELLAQIAVRGPDVGLWRFVALRGGAGAQTPAAREAVAWCRESHGGGGPSYSR